MDLYNRLSRLPFTNVFIMKIISAIILKTKIKNIHCSSAILGKIVEYSSKILDDKILDNKNIYSGWL